MKYNYAILGLGQTGYSCVEYLSRQGQTFIVLDDREAPPYLAELKKHYPEVELELGQISTSRLSQAEKVLVSPGLPLNHAWLVYAKAHNKPIVTDIGLFMEVATAPIVLVTGSNGKSTVVKLIAHLASTTFQVLIGGNYGVPALDLLKEAVPDYYVLELSSFQLIYTDTIHSFAATVLNITPNHLDWHASMEEYAQAKLKIYKHCEHPIVLDSLRESYPNQCPVADNLFALDSAQETIFFKHQPLLNTRELPLPGKSYYSNVVAAFGLAYQMGVSLTELVRLLKTFRGLPHRCELIAEEDGCYWYNDSKATTIAAVIAAVDAIKDKHNGRLLLILSGLTKGVDLTPLKQAISDKIDFLVLLGPAIWPCKSVFSETPSIQVSTMEEAVRAAKNFVKPDDVVLLSPAGASFDLFKNYQHRGEVFSNTVKEMICLNKSKITNF